jgi:hypothetical protein
MTDPNRLSRRQMLGAAAGITVAGAIGAVEPAHATKVPEAAVKYQDKPNGEARCGTCGLFQPPSSCETVDGTISPNGWCLIYRRKSA